MFDAFTEAKRKGACDFFLTGSCYADLELRPVLLTQLPSAGITRGEPSPSLAVCFFFKQRVLGLSYCMVVADKVENPVSLETVGVVQCFC